MKALSIKPPYAYFIIYGVPYGVSVDNGDGTTSVRDSGEVVLKDIENRTWRTALRERIYIHAGIREAPIEEVLELFHKIGLPFGSALMGYSKRLPHGAIIGKIDLVDCVQDSKSPWAIPGQNHLILRNPETIKPIPYRGQQRFFEVQI